MTNLEAFKGILEGAFTDAQLTIFLVNNGLNPTDEYVKENKKFLILAKIDSLLLLVNSTQSVRELDYQITERSTKDLLDLIGALYSEIGVKNKLIANKIRGRKVW